MEEAARPLRWKIYWNGPSREDDIPRQIQIVNRAIARHVSGLILAPGHAVALISPVRSAIARGIPTVIVGSRLGTAPSPKLTFVLNDDAADGLLAARRVESYLGEADTVAVLGVNSNLLGTIDRADAFETEIHHRFPSARIVERRTTSFGFAEAETMAEEVIRSERDLRVIVSLNVNQTRAAYQALVDTGQLQRIRLVGCDQDLDLVHHLRSGGIDALIVQNTFQMGADAIRSIRNQQLGRPQEIRTLVQPLLVTRENVDSGPVQLALSMDWTRY